jgi:hypothetical protein
MAISDSFVWKARDTAEQSGRRRKRKVSQDGLLGLCEGAAGISAPCETRFPTGKSASQLEFQAAIGYPGENCRSDTLRAMSK